jgi:hypothetical protein
MFFETAQLPPGPHHLTVVYKNSGEWSTPISFSNLLIERGESNHSSPLDPTSSASGLPSPSISASAGKNIPTGAIVGSTLGGVALIVAAILLTILIRRCKSRSPKNSHGNKVQSPFIYPIRIPPRLQIRYLKKEPMIDAGVHEAHGGLERVASFRSDASTTVVPPRRDSGEGQRNEVAARAPVKQR